MGGAIFSYKSNTTTNISNCIFNKNTADNGGSISAIEPPRRVDDGDSQTKKNYSMFFLEFFTASLSQRFLILHLRY